MKKVLSLLFALVFVISAFPVTIASAADVIEISDAAQLAAIGNNDNYPLSGSYKLTKNISLSDYDNWAPIGSSSAFSGTFEGNGKTISGLKVNSSGTYAGLFGQVSGTIKNLTVTGSVTLNSTSSSATSVYAGILAGNVSGWFATIDSCSTTGEVNATLNCTASWGIGSANVYAGGVVGNNSSWIAMEVLSHKSGAVTASYSGSKVSGNAYAGGIAGKTSSGLIDCYNKAEITSTSAKGSSYAGGLAGQCATTETSYNTGAVTAATNCGAIAGYATGASTNCYYETGSASQAFGGYSGSTAPTATGKKANDMTNKKLTGFNFDDVWESSLFSAPNHYSKNEIITGSLSVLGTFQVGEKLTADMSNVTPTSAYDGVIKYVKYQWERGTKDSEGNISYEKISGATGNSYTLSSSDLGKYVRLVVRGRFTYGGKLESKETLVTAATPKNVKVATDDNGIKVTWDKISGATNYTVYRSEYSEGFMGFGAGFGSYSSVGTATTNSYLDTSVTNNKKYKYKVSVTMGGAESEQSQESAEITAQLACQHSWDSGKETTAAKCETAGVKTYTCSLCNATRTETIPAKGHNYKTISETAATCEKDGSKTVRCANCFTNKTETTPATGHNYNSGVITTQPGCETEGVKTFICANCNGTKTEAVKATGHSFSSETVTKQPTCTTTGIKTGTCTKCKQVKEVVIPALEHSFSSTTITKQATCEETGIKTGTCTSCKQTREEVIPALGHAYSPDFTIDKYPNYNEPGSQSRHCVRCDARTDVTELPKLELFAPPTITSVVSEQNGVRLYWDSVEGVEGYMVFKLIDGAYKNIAILNPSTRTFCDIEAVNGETYCYAVASMDYWGNAGEYSEIAVTYKKLTELATPEVKRSNTAKGIKVTWNAIEDEETYIVYRSVYNASTKKWSKWASIKKGVTGTSYTDTKVKLGTHYKYTVRAVNGDVMSGYKGTGGIKYNVTPTVKIANASAGIKVSWTTAANATGYTVYRSQYNTKTKKWTSWKNMGTAKSNKTSWIDKKVTSGVKYKYTVRACNGKSIKSSYKASVTLLYLAQPKTTVKSVSNGINVSWTQSSGATGYTVYRSEYNVLTGKWSNWKNMGTAKSNKKSWVDKSAKRGIKYKYTVRAVNGNVKSAYTSSGTVKR